MERFQDKVAIVTGGAQGIGEAIARKLAAESAKVAILDIQHEKAQAVADDISSSGDRAVGVKMDITESRDVWQAVYQPVHQNRQPFPQPEPPQEALQCISE